jgi:hypothetical protein
MRASSRPSGLHMRPKTLNKGQIRITHPSSPDRSMVADPEVSWSTWSSRFQHFLFLLTSACVTYNILKATVAVNRQARLPSCLWIYEAEDGVVFCTKLRRLDVQFAYYWAYCPFVTKISRVNILSPLLYLESLQTKTRLRTTCKKVACIV